MFLAFNGDDNKGERQWITISGTHVPLDEDGGLGGKVGEKIEKMASWDCRSQISHTLTNAISVPGISSVSKDVAVFHVLDAIDSDILYAFDKVNGYEPKSFNQIILDAKSSIVLAKKLLTRRTF